jgi:hypothetical protein
MADASIGVHQPSPKLHEQRYFGLGFAKSAKSYLRADLLRKYIAMIAVPLGNANKTGFERWLNCANPARGQLVRL